MTAIICQIRLEYSKYKNIIHILLGYHYHYCIKLNHHLMRNNNNELIIYSLAYARTVTAIKHHAPGLLRNHYPSKIYRIYNIVIIERSSIIFVQLSRITKEVFFSLSFTFSTLHQREQKLRTNIILFHF